MKKKKCLHNFQVSWTCTKCGFTEKHYPMVRAIGKFLNDNTLAHDYIEVQRDEHNRVIKDYE